MTTQSINSGMTLSLAAAAKLCGSSEGRFRYNRESLVAAGVTITDEGWRIPVDVLLTFGWVKTEVVAALEPTPLQKAEQEIVSLRAEVASLQAELAEQSRGRGFFGRRR